MNITITINYANNCYKSSQKLNSETALVHGTDRVIEYTFSDIDNNLYRKNQEILDKERGNRYWIWKPISKKYGEIKP